MNIEGKKIAVTGANGFIGKALCQKLEERGAILTKISRKKSSSENTILWDPIQGTLNRNELIGIDAVIHLAGESIAEKWTPEKRKAIIESRNIGTQLICERIARVRPKIKSFIMASGTGYYDENSGPHNEDGWPGKSFLSQVVSEWEAAARPAIDAGIRVVKMRTGVVIGSGGGAIEKMLPFFKKGLGGKIGKGTQDISWISIDDIVNAYIFALENEAIEGIVNAVSPQMTNNKTLSHLLAKKLNRPAFFTIPKTAIQILYGQMGKETLLDTNQVKPTKLLEAGFKWKDKEIIQALEKAIKQQK